MHQRYMDIPDEELARRTRLGDEDAFEELVLRHQSSVRRWIRWIDRCPARVDDLAQEAFIKAWRARKDFRGDSSWRTWIMRIALRVCIDQKRRAEPATEPVTPQMLPDGMLLPDMPEMEQVVLDRSRLEAVREALDNMPHAGREIIVLKYIEGYNATEIGKITGRPPGTVRRLLFEALKALRMAMKLDGAKKGRNRGQI